MVNENIIPKTETVYEIKNEAPSFEEFMKTYEHDETSEFLAEAEYQGRVLHGPQYGPGNSQSSSHTDEERQIATGIGLGGAAATAALSFVCPPAGAAVAVTYAAIGTTAKVTKNLSTDKDVKEGAELVDNVFSTAALGGSVGKLPGSKCLGHFHP